MDDPTRQVLSVRRANGWIFRSKILQWYPFPPFVMSLQGSLYAYSQPRETLPSLYDYDAVEMALGVVDEDNDVGMWGTFYNPTEVGMKSPRQRSSDGVFPYVPLSEVEDILNEFFRLGGRIVSEV